MAIGQRSSRIDQTHSDTTINPLTLLSERLASLTAHVAVLGLGYAGLPMAIELARAGFHVTGLDVDSE